MLIRSTLVSEYDERFNCRACLMSIRSRSRGVEQEKKALWQKGCATVVPHIVFQDEAFKYRTCPRMHHNMGARELIHAESLMDKGILPFDGGYMDQPAKIMEAFSVIRSFKQAKLREETAKKQTRVRAQGRVKRG